MAAPLSWTDEDGDSGGLCDYADKNGGDEGEQVLLTMDGGDLGVLIERGHAEAIVRWLIDFYDLEPPT